MMEILYILAILILIAIIVFMSIKYFELQRLYITLRKQVNSQTLDYHLKRINELGYDFTLKASSKQPKSRSGKKITKRKSINELIDQ